jgi:predicted kinase
MNFKLYLEDLNLNEGINDIGILKAVFMVGSPGSGKSYTLKQVTSGKIAPRLVNTDKFFEYFGNDPSFKDKSMQLTAKQLVNYLNSMLPLFIESTSSNPNNLIRRKGLLESIGYDIAGVFVETPLDTAIARVRKRERKVPEDFIRKVYDKIMELKDFYHAKFSPFVTIKNDDGELTQAAILSAYKSVSSFFTKPLENPLGKSLVERMIASGEKYLIPNMYSQDYLQTIVKVWYSK